MEASKWKHWQQRSIAQLWEAVALSCDVDPNEIDAEAARRAERKGGAFADRLRLAKDAITSGAITPLTHYVADSQRHRSVVRLEQFAVFARSKAWRVPKPFAAMASESDARPRQPKRKHAEGEALAPKSETAYLNIIGALCELYWKGIRAKNDKDIVQARIIESIQREFPGVAGLSERNLKAKLSAAIKSLRA